MEQLAKNYEAFEIIVAYHYRYYQFYGNMLVAIPTSLGFYLLTFQGEREAFFVGFVGLFLEFIFFLGSKDSFKKYVDRSNELLEAKMKIIY